jgi:hypothetical protein
VYPEAPRLKQPQEMLEKIGINKYCRPGFGWVNSSKMRNELEKFSETLNPNENAAVKAIIQIISENGGLPADSPAPRVFE